MKYMIVFALYLCSSCGFQSKNNQLSQSELRSQNATPFHKLHLSFEINSNFSIDNKKDINVHDDHLSARFSNYKESIRSVLNKLEISQKPKNIFQFTAKFSSVPYLIKGTTADSVLNGDIRDPIYNRLGEKIDVALNNLAIYVESQVEKAFASQVFPADTSEAIIEKMKNEQINASMNLLKYQLEQTKLKYQNTIDDRVDDLKFETSLQEFALTYARTVGSKDDILYIKFGKYYSGQGPKLADDYQSDN